MNGSRECMFSSEVKFMMFVVININENLRMEFVSLVMCGKVEIFKVMRLGYMILLKNIINVKGVNV